jgi:hypothetical protein
MNAYNYKLSVGHTGGLSRIKIRDRETVFTTRILSLRCLKYQDFNLLVRCVNTHSSENRFTKLYSDHVICTSHTSCTYIPLQILAKLKEKDLGLTYGAYIPLNVSFCEARKNYKLYMYCCTTFTADSCVKYVRRTLKFPHCFYFRRANG